MSYATLYVSSEEQKYGEIFEKGHFYCTSCAHTKNKDINLLLYFINFVLFSLSHNVTETLMVMNYMLNFSKGLYQM